MISVYSADPIVTRQLSDGRLCSGALCRNPAGVWAVIGVHRKAVLDTVLLLPVTEADALAAMLAGLPRGAVPAGGEVDALLATVPGGGDLFLRRTPDEVHLALLYADHDPRRLRPLGERVVSVLAEDGPALIAVAVSLGEQLTQRGFAGGTSSAVH